MCGCVLYVSETHRGPNFLDYRDVIYQTGALAWKCSFLSSDRETDCVLAVKFVSAFEGETCNKWEEI